MDALFLVFLVVGLGLATWFFMRDPSAKEKITEAVEDATDFVEDVVEDVVETVEEVKVELDKVTPKPKLPTTKVLEGMTKAKLEETGREYGVELDRRMTKANMIKDLRAQYKKL
jgi:hypothetical protein